MLYHISDNLHSQSCQANRHFRLINAVIETARKELEVILSAIALFMRLNSDALKWDVSRESKLPENVVAITLK